MAKELIKEARRMQQLAGIINENYVDLAPINSPFMESEEDSDMDDVESDEEELDYFCNKPGKRDEFDTEDDIEPAAKDVTAGDAIAKSAGSKQGKLDMLTKKKNAILAKFKANVKDLDRTSPEYKAAMANYTKEIGDTLIQIKKLQADIDRDLSIDDEDEF